MQVGCCLMYDLCSLVPDICACADSVCNCLGQVCLAACNGCDVGQMAAAVGACVSGAVTGVKQVFNDVTGKHRHDAAGHCLQPPGGTHPQGLDPSAAASVVHPHAA